jgi:hypothetical protein
MTTFPDRRLSMTTFPDRRLSMTTFPDRRLSTTRFLCCIPLKPLRTSRRRRPFGLFHTTTATSGGGLDQGNGNERPYDVEEGEEQAWAGMYFHYSGQILT